MHAMHLQGIHLLNPPTSSYSGQLLKSTEAATSP